MRSQSATTDRLLRQRKKFSTLEEVHDYFANDKLVCLLCGKSYVQLVAHIGPAHGISADSYKEQFGIPWTYGLAGKAFRQRCARHMKALQRSGKMPLAPSRNHIRKMLAAGKRRRPHVDALLNDSRQKLLALHGRKEKWGPKEFKEYLRRIKLGRTPVEVGQDKDMPGVELFRRRVKQDADLRTRFAKIWDRLPYAVHARASKLSERFQRDVVKLRRRDMSWREVAAELGVSVGTARSTWHELKKSGKLTSRDLTHETKRFTSADYEEYLRRIALGRTVADVAQDADMPASLNAYLKRKPSFRKRYQKILDGLPYDVQARRRRRMGERFRKEVVTLRKKGHNWPAIAEALGVHLSTARRAWRRYEQR